MKLLTSIGAATYRASYHPTSVIRLRGIFNGAVDSFLQLFDQSTDPADGTAPAIAAIPLYAGQPFFAEFEIGYAEFQVALYACVSTTQATKTVSAETMDLTIEVSEPDRNPAVSFAGDLTSAVTGLQVWSEAANAARKKRLLALEVDGTNLAGVADQFIQIFAHDTVNTGDVPIISLPILPGTVLTGVSRLTFGQKGVDVFQIQAGTSRVGCTIKISTTSPGYTAAAGTATIRAEHT